MVICDEVQVHALAAMLEHGGGARVRLYGRSMLPMVFPGLAACIEPVGATDCVPGDVVVVSKDGCITAHRWIGGEPGRWILQADAFEEPDPPVTDEQVLGRVAGLPLGRWTLPVPTPIRTRISGQLLAAMPSLRRSWKRTRLAIRGPARRAQQVMPVRALRTHLQPWRLERFELQYLPKIRRAILRRGERPIRAVLDAWANLADSAHGAALVAVAGDRIVGHASFVRDREDPEIARHGYLWVDRWYRSLGIASTLKREIAELAREQGYRELTTRARWGSDSMRASVRVGFEATRSEDGQFADMRLVLR